MLQLKKNGGTPLNLRFLKINFAISRRKEGSKLCRENVILALDLFLVSIVFRKNPRGAFFFSEFQNLKNSHFYSKNVSHFSIFSIFKNQRRKKRNFYFSAVSNTWRKWRNSSVFKRKTRKRGELGNVSFLKFSNADFFELKKKSAKKTADYFSDKFVLNFVDFEFSCSADEFGITIVNNPTNNERPLGSARNKEKILRKIKKKSWKTQNRSISSAKKVMIGPTCESSFEKMFDHVVASLPSNSSTRVSFENLNDFVKSSKR